MRVPFIIESLRRKKGRLRNSYLRMSAGIETRLEFFCELIGEAVGMRQKISEWFIVARRKKMYLSTDCYALKDVKIPLLGSRDEKLFLLSILEDTFYSYLYLQDNYDVSDVKHIDGLIPEGFYIYRDRARGIDMSLRPGDVVIDAGAWVGDFSAYASVRGARAYAFEPLPETFEILLKTSRLNKNIIPFNMGLGSEKDELEMLVNERNTGSSSISSRSRGDKLKKVHITTLDDFVSENKIERVDFIKADIEGHERFMISGAKNVLRRFGPRLAICTYHLPDDPEVLESTIREINPAYEVIQGRKKLFAYIPD